MADYQQYKGWEIEKYGGHITISRYCASKNDNSFWMFKLREVKGTIDNLESKDLNFQDISELYRKPLYN
jgi:hypothetical protein